MAQEVMHTCITCALVLKEEHSMRSVGCADMEGEEEWLESEEKEATVGHSHVESCSGPSPHFGS